MAIGDEEARGVRHDVRRHASGRPWTTQDYLDYLAGWQAERLPWARPVYSTDPAMTEIGRREARAA